jgi:DNA-binding CsgD family transcriptional regulator/HD-like signal output (HDOD) protein
MPRGAKPGGRRLTEAIAAVERLPMLAESRRRLRRLAGEPAAQDQVTETVESDLALVIAVLHAANGRAPGGGPVGGVAEAVRVLTPAGVEAATEDLDAYELLDPPGEWQGQLEPLRRHAVATKHAAIRLAELGGHANRDQLALAGLLHDVGRLVLARLYPGYGELAQRAAGAPDQRIQAERRELGIDHALVGGALTFRWGLSGTVTSTVERHHADDVEGPDAVIALADQLAHESHGDPVAAARISELGGRAGVDDGRLQELLFEFPHAHVPPRRPPEPCPLSARELDALRGLAQGKVYKEIADDLSLSASTVRTHLHNVYRKVGAVDRAQAVLIARDSGWI